jgi:signal transduction histidine kinase
MRFSKQHPIEVTPSIPEPAAGESTLFRTTKAIKFTPSGGSVSIELESGGDCHTITVSDTGEGISAEFLPFVFNRYLQADRTARRGGLGLGLTIARHIVELHSGTIRAESRGKGEGATFIVQLPRRANF